MITGNVLYPNVIPLCLTANHLEIRFLLLLFSFGGLLLPNVNLGKGNQDSLY